MNTDPEIITKVTEDFGKSSFLSEYVPYLGMEWRLGDGRIPAAMSIFISLCSMYPKL